jgi:hypothetical protein
LCVWSVALPDSFAHPGRQRSSLIHFGWVAWALLNVLTFWWWEFGLSRIEWNFGIYFFVCLYASMFFLSVLLFPDDLREYDGYEDYFLSRRDRWGPNIRSELPCL